LKWAVYCQKNLQHLTENYLSNEKKVDFLLT
jgi:hypothetical protein